VSRASLFNVVGLLAAVAGILIELAGGVDFPAVPPGLVILLATIAVVVLARRWWWSALVGVIAPAVMLVGGFVAEPGILPLLREPEETLPFTGAVVQLAGLVLAIAAGLVAVATAWGRSRARSRL
jgi:hypothetical protein